MTQLPDKLPPYTMLDFDWAQAELYMLSLFAQDSALRDALYSGDVHRQTMAWALNMDPADVTDDMREVSKVIIYAAPYSGFDIPSTVSNAVKKAHLKGIALTNEEAERTMVRIIETYSALYEWTGRALLSWYDSGGWIAYFMNQRRRIIYPDYLKRDVDGALRRSTDGRTAINGYGQNSVGLLLKFYMAGIWNDPFLRANTRQHLPLFDAHLCLAKTEHVAEIHRRLHALATPVLRHNGFEIRMKADWKGSLTSWGDLRKLPAPDLGDLQPPVYAWDSEFYAEAPMPLPEASDVNPFMNSLAQATQS